jgi:hypothetical protein
LRVVHKAKAEVASPFDASIAHAARGWGGQEGTSGWDDRAFPVTSQGHVQPARSRQLLLFSQLIRLQASSHQSYRNYKRVCLGIGAGNTMLKKHAFPPTRQPYGPSLRLAVGTYLCTIACIRIGVAQDRSQISPTFCGITIERHQPGVATASQQGRCE